MSFQAPVSGPVARSLPKDVIRVRQVPAGVAGIKQNVISNCASALRRSRLRIGAVRSRARKQAVVAQTITSPCLIPVQALRQLDVCAEWVGDVGDAGGRAGTGVAGHIELLAVGLQFLAETGEILNLKADMIEPAAFGPHCGRRCL